MASEDSDQSKGEDETVLSHKQQRRLKRKRERGEIDDATSKPKAKKAKTQAKEEKVEPAPPIKRENSVWVGNLAYKTTADDLRKFFDGVGEITRVNMPKGPIKGSATKRENSGYAYVDFANEDVKQIAISMSEQHLHGRRLLIKDGSDYKGSKSATAALSTEGKPVSLTKSSRRILATQKEPPCPVLFLGNLGYDATKEQVKEMLLHHVQIKGKPVSAKRKPEAPHEETKADATSDEDENVEQQPKAKGVLTFEPTSEPIAEPQKHQKSQDKQDTEIKSPESVLGLRKIRLFTFPDTGKCKGFCFLDFESTAHATAALIHPGNHQWNNRALILQYASLDAVRRGGYKDADGKRVFVRGAKSKPGTGDAEEAGLEGVEEAEPAPVELKEFSAQHDEPAFLPQRRGPTGGRTKQQRTRPKPGAALATAQRATAGIVPGQGTKVKFS